MFVSETINTNPEKSEIHGRNGSAKMSAILVQKYSRYINISGISSRGRLVSNAGLDIELDPKVLRELAKAINQAADAVEKEQATTA